MRTLLLVLALLAPLESVDLEVRRAVQEARTPALEGPARLLSDKLGRPQVTFGVLLAMCVLGGAAEIALARLALATLIPVNLVVEVVKRATDRTRPDGQHDRNNASFPSSHSANVFALMAVFARRWRRAAPAFLLFAFCMAFSRIYLDRHWFSDVVVGSALGLLGAWLVGAWWERRHRPAAAAPVVGGPQV